jgi:predicted metal-dependent HD superfamily phosphohydrolase
MNYTAIITELRTHIEQVFNESGQSLPYHNATHTKAVLDASNELADHYQITEEERFIVNSAALFHDLGITQGGTANHEIRSAEMAENWLKERGITHETIERIKGCIMATKLPQKPENLLEEIIGDADLWHLGTENFTINQKLLRQEFTEAGGKEVEKDAWRLRNIALLSSHQFHTEFAKGLLQGKKEEHLNRLKGKLEKKQLEAENPNEGKKSKKKEIDPNIPTRGIETMFRVTIHNHLELSSMADSKANIMISVNSIIVSVVLSVLLRRLEESPELIIPTSILLVVNVCTIVFAILAVRPKILSSKTPPPTMDLEQKKPNLLFFGSFNKMPLDLYTVKMKEMMGDKDYLYENMINNIYFMGIVLGRKYHWLRIAYNVFMYGFITAVLAFALAMIL